MADHELDFDSMPSVTIRLPRVVAIDLARRGGYERGADGIYRLGTRHYPDVATAATAAIYEILAAGEDR